MRRATSLVLGTTVLCLASCGRSGGDAQPAGAGADSGGGQKPRYVIGVIAKSQANPVFQAARTGAVDAARELGEQMGVEVTIDWRTPNAEDAQQQAQYVEQLASQGVNGIAISCTDANVLTPAIDSAVGSGVTVVCFDSDAPASQRLAYYGVDDVEAGKAVMTKLAEQMGGQGVVAILAGNQSAPNLQARVRGVREVADTFPGISVIDTYYHAETAPDAAARMQQVQAANPDITGWALVGGWPLYTDNALDGIAGNAKVVSMDPLPLPLDYVRKGEVQVLVGQPYYGWGYESVRIILERVHNGNDPASTMVTAPLEYVTADNVDAFATNWQKWNPVR